MNTRSVTDKEALALCKAAEEIYDNPRPPADSADERMIQEHQKISRYNAVVPKLVAALRQRLD